jgi:putative phosphonate catabolism associated alcohol dehydrogenase
MTTTAGDRLTSSGADGVASARFARWNGVGLPSTVAATPIPAALTPGEVLVEIDFATVCGSDVHTANGRRPSPAPGVLGHEQVGRVVALGPGVVPATTSGAPLAVGMRVVWSVTSSCGHCDRCRADLPQKCLHLRKYGHEPLTDEWLLSGGFATHCLLRPGTDIVPVPDDLPDEVASPASCATATVMAVLRAAGRPLAGARVLVSGAGMLGLTAVAVASSAGADVTAVDPDPDRREQALAFGADRVTEPGAPVGPVDVAVELSGAASAVSACLDALDIGGTLVLAGSVSPGPSVPLDPERIVRRLQTVVGVHNYRPIDLEDAVAFLVRHHTEHPFAELVTGRWRLDELDRALAAAARGGAPRQGVVPRS